MNAVYLLLPRLLQAKRWGKETLAGGGLDNRQFNDYVKDGPLTQFFEAPDTVWTPRVLKDGSDSVGALGALNRVYHQHRDVQRRVAAALQRAGRRQARHADHDCRRAEEFRLLQGHRSADARHGPVLPQDHRRRTISKDAPGGERYLSKDEPLLTRGKVVFAENCARCHSSKTVPPPVPGLDPAGCAGKDYLGCWNRYWDWTETPEFKEKMRAIVLAPDFLDDNYLSAEFRVPVTLLETNACSPLATNAIGGNIWDNFSSQSYKDLPSVGEITWYHPYTGEPQTYTMPAGGRGYTRPPSLDQPLVDGAVPAEQQRRALRIEPVGRRRGCDRSRTRSSRCCGPRGARRTRLLGDKIPGMIDRTPAADATCASPRGYLPDFLQKLPARSAPAEGVQRRRHRDRSDSDRHADRPAREREPAL